MTYFKHVTMTTGHRVDQPREGVSDDTIRRLSEVLDIVLQGGRAALIDGYTLTGVARGSALMATMWAGSDPIITIAIALRQRGAASLWREMHKDRPDLATDPDAPPAAPWIGDRLEAGADRNLDAVMWTGDLSRSLAWTWHDYRGASA